MTGCCDVALVNCAFAPTVNERNRGIDAGCPAAAVLEALQRVIGHEQQENRSGLGAGLQAERAARRAMETDRLAVHAQGAVAPPGADDESGLEHRGEHQHALRAADEFLRTRNLAEERRERVVDAGIELWRRVAGSPASGPVVVQPVTSTNTPINAARKCLLFIVKTLY